MAQVVSVVLPKLSAEHCSQLSIIRGWISSVVHYPCSLRSQHEPPSHAMLWSSTVCQSMGKVEVLALLPGSPTTGCLAGVQHGTARGFAPWLLRCIHRMLWAVDGWARLCAALGCWCFTATSIAHIFLCLCLLYSIIN